MKKKLTVLIAALMGMSLAHGDIAIELQNTDDSVTQPGGASFVSEVLVQLIWTPTIPIPKAEIGGAPATGEFVLKSLITTSGFGGTWPNQPQGVAVYTDADVGNTDINSGYIVVRLYDSTALGWGDFYLQQAQEGSPLTDYDSGNSATVYNTDIGITGGALDSQGLMIIPEPAVASLLVVFGGGMLAFRRIFSRS